MTHAEKLPGRRSVEALGLRVRLTSLNGPFSEPLDIRGMIACEQSERQAVVTMRSVYKDELDATVRQLNCEVETLPISFEDTYAMVVRGRPNGGAK